MRETLAEHHAALLARTFALRALIPPQVHDVDRAELLRETRAHAGVHVPVEPVAVRDEGDDALFADPRPSAAPSCRCRRGRRPTGGSRAFVRGLSQWPCAPGATRPRPGQSSSRRWGLLACASKRGRVEGELGNARANAGALNHRAVEGGLIPDRAIAQRLAMSRLAMRCVRFVHPRQRTDAQPG